MRLFTNLIVNLPCYYFIIIILVLNIHISFLSEFSFIGSKHTRHKSKNLNFIIILYNFFLCIAQGLQSTSYTYYVWKGMRNFSKRKASTVNTYTYISVQTALCNFSVIVFSVVCKHSFISINYIKWYTILFSISNLIILDQVIMIKGL